MVGGKGDDAEGDMDVVMVRVTVTFIKKNRVIVTRTS